LRSDTRLPHVRAVFLGTGLERESRLQPNSRSRQGRDPPLSAGSVGASLPVNLQLRSLITNRPPSASIRQKPSSHQSIDPPMPMTRRTPGSAGSPNGSVQSSTRSPRSSAQPPWLLLPPSSSREAGAGFDHGRGDASPHPAFSAAASGASASTCCGVQLVMSAASSPAASERTDTASRCTRWRARGLVDRRRRGGDADPR
jgi:hypothetical protein